MRTRISRLALMAVLFSAGLHAQWVQIDIPSSGGVSCLGTSGTNLFAGTWFGEFFQTTDKGSSWTAASTGLPPGKYVRSFIAEDGDLFAGIYESGVYRSTDNGTSWMAANTGLPMYRAYVSGLVHGNGTLFAAISGIYQGGVYRSINKGTGWSQCFEGRSTTALALTGNTLFAGVSGGGVYRSTDNGTTWTGVNNGIDYAYILSLAATGSVVFAGTQLNMVFCSTDNGENWTNASSGLPMPLGSGAIRSLAVSGTNVFAATNDGVYLSTDNGRHWSATGLANSIVYSLTCDDVALFAGTASGVWKRPLAEMIAGVESHKEELPGQFALEQNYPNPFNPATTIRYALPHRSHVTLTVFNMLGQKMAELVNGEDEAGYHEVEFGLTTLASGVYFYRLTAGTYAETKRMILIR